MTEVRASSRLFRMHPQSRLTRGKCPLVAVVVVVMCEVLIVVKIVAVVMAGTRKGSPGSSGGGCVWGVYGDVGGG
jgi:hypothetical protein